MLLHLSVSMSLGTIKLFQIVCDVANNDRPHPKLHTEVLPKASASLNGPHIEP